MERQVLVSTHMAEGVQVVVGQFEFLEGDKLFGPVSSRCRRVGMNVQSTWNSWIRLPTH